MSATKRVLVLFSGCGHLDGSEIHEAVACLAALTRNGLSPVGTSPDRNQFHVINHAKGEPVESESRNVLLESARIFRGPILPLHEAKMADYSGLVVPGGFGVAKNLSDFAFKGSDMSVDDEVGRLICDFHGQSKPIALCCIAPMLAAKALSDKKVKITLGKCGDLAKWPHQAAIDVARQLGAEVEDCDVDEVCVDSKNRLITSPAFMYDGHFHEVQAGVNAMIDKFASML